METIVYVTTTVSFYLNFDFEFSPSRVALVNVKSGILDSSTPIPTRKESHVIDPTRSTPENHQNYESEIRIKIILHDRPFRPRLRRRRIEARKYGEEEDSRRICLMNFYSSDHAYMIHTHARLMRIYNVHIRERLRYNGA